MLSLTNYIWLKNKGHFENSGGLKKVGTNTAVRLLLGWLQRSVNQIERETFIQEIMGKHLWNWVLLHGRFQKLTIYFYLNELNLG